MRSDHEIEDRYHEIKAISDEIAANRQLEMYRQTSWHVVPEQGNRKARRAAMANARRRLK